MQMRSAEVLPEFLFPGQNWEFLPTLVGGASPTILPPEHVVACTSPACARLMSQGDYLRKRRRGWVGHEFWGKSLRVNESLTALFM